MAQDRHRPLYADIQSVSPPECHIQFSPERSSRLVYWCLGRITKAAVSRQIQVFVISLIKQVIHARTDFHVLIQSIRCIGRKHRKPGAVVNVFTDNISVIDGNATLMVHQTQPSRTAPVSFSYFSPKRASSGGDLRQRLMVITICSS